MSSIAEARGKKTRFECIIPILSVKNVSASIDYYVKVLGFKKDWDDGDSPTMASVSRDNFSIMLCQGAQGQPGTWIWIGVESVEELFEEYKVQGATIQHKPTNYSWAYEMRLEDPDGHVLRIGSEPKEGEPYKD
jgi:predicted lactoylglutathione lyase